MPHTQLPLDLYREEPPEPRLRVAVHDRSRVEWVATTPVAPAGVTHTWEIALELQVPDAMWVAHQPWDHFTVRSRLTSPGLRSGERQTGDAMDCVRRRALAVSHMLKVQTLGMVRTLLAVRRQGGNRPDCLDDAQGRALAARIHAVHREAHLYRERLRQLATPGALAGSQPVEPAHSQALAREVLLADEYVSNHVLVLVTKLLRLLEVRHRRHRPPLPALQGGAHHVRAALTAVLQAETAHRVEAQIRHAAPQTKAELEALVNRAALLKKHFQQALFLEARAYMVDQRLRNWIAALVAMIASSFYFAWQVWVLNAAMSTAQTTVSLVLAGAVAALVYAAKDRIKEVGRDWVARRVKDTYADRVAHLRLQQRMDPVETEFGLARETISLAPRLQADPLNPALGKTHVVYQLTIRERLRHTGLELLHKQGMTGLKHVFRYDLSPLFSKLDDHAKRVPVLQTGAVPGVSIQAASRVYSVPVTAYLRPVGLPPGQGTELSIRGVIQLQRGGLVRFVPAPDGKPRQASGLVPAQPATVAGGGGSGTVGGSAWPASLSSGQFPPITAR